MNNMILNIKMGRNTSIQLVIAKSDFHIHCIFFGPIPTEQYINILVVLVIVVQTNILLLFLVICMNKDLGVSLCS